LATLAAPETWRGEVIELLASGLSMMILPPPGIGVASTPVAPEEVAGVAEVAADALADAEAEADAELVVRTKLVLLSPPHAAREAARTVAAAPRKSFFMSQSVGTAINLIPATSISVSERKF
jgi:hypothetical protein